MKIWFMMKWDWVVCKSGLFHSEKVENFIYFPPSIFLSRGCNTTIRVKQKTHMNFRHYRGKNVQGKWNLRVKWAACKMSTSTQSTVIQELHMQWCHAYMYLNVEKITHITEHINTTFIYINTITNPFPTSETCCNKTVDCDEN